MKEMDMFAPANKEEKEALIQNLTKGTAAFGIDLGTTNSAISVIPKGTAPLIIPLRNGKTTIPSCVLWTGEPGEFIVGVEAYEKRYYPNCIYSVKRLMQTPDAIVTLEKDGKKLQMTPAEVSAEILKALVKETNGYYGDIKDVVITVPAKFNEIGRSNTRKAAELAGLNLLGIISEPTAASMCYELTPEDNGSREILVYDLGGGTFDISLVQITGAQDYSEVDDLYEIPQELRKERTETTIRAIDGDGNVNLGGDDIDREIYNIFMRELVARGVDISYISKEEENRIILMIEKLKKDNIHDSTTLRIRIDDRPDHREGVVLSYPVFRAGLLPTYEKTRALVNSVLQRNKSRADTIVLVGGSTKSELIKEFLETDYPGYIINNAFPADEAVSLGAGIHARVLKFGDNNVSVFDSLVDSIGVIADDSVKPIIERGSQFPVTKEKVFATVVDDQQALGVDIVQGNSSLVEETCKLGTLEITDLPKGKAGEVIIRVQLSIDVKGLLRCSVIISSKSSHQTITREMKLSLSSGSADAQKQLDRSEKLLIRWKKVASRMPEDKRKALLEALDRFPKELNEYDIAKLIKELK